ncbi:MAG: hypothetical protein ABWK00_07110 [Desulfurococcaceae archaeon]
MQPSRAMRFFTWRGGLASLAIANAVLLLMSIYRNYYDVQYFLQWYGAATSRGVLSIYGASTKAAYMPPPILLYISMRYLVVGVLGLDDGPRTVGIVIEKLPFILCFNAIFLFMRRRYGLMPALYWLASLAAYNSAFGPQFDVFAALLSLISLSELEKGRPGRSMLFAALAASFKQVFALLALPAFLLELRRRGVARALADAALYVALPLLAISLPFLLADPANYVGKAILFHGGRYPQELSPWALPIYALSFNVAALPDWISWAWAIPFAAFVAHEALKIYREAGGGGLDPLRRYASLATGLVLLNKVGNPNYLMWPTPFLAIACGRRHDDEGWRRFRNVYVFAPVLSGLLYPFFTIYVAAVAGGDVFMGEDLNRIPAEAVVELNFGAGSVLYRLLTVLRSSMGLYSLFYMIYSYAPITYSIFTIAYSACLAYVLAKVEWGWR